MRKSWLLVILLVTLLLAACQGGAAPNQPTQPAAGEPEQGLTAAPGEAYPMTDQPAMPGPGSGSELWSAYPPAESDGALTRGNVFIDESGLMAVEGQPGAAQLAISGNLPTPCHQLRAQVNPPDANNVVAVEVYSLVDPNMMCTQVLKPFSGQMATIAGLPSGSYTVTVNGEEVGKLDVP